MNSLTYPRETPRVHVYVSMYIVYTYKYVSVVSATCGGECGRGLRAILVCNPLPSAVFRLYSRNSNGSEMGTASESGNQISNAFKPIRRFRYRVIGSSPGPPFACRSAVPRPDNDIIIIVVTGRRRNRPILILRTESRRTMTYIRRIMETVRSAF